LPTYSLHGEPLSPRGADFADYPAMMERWLALLSSAGGMQGGGVAKGKSRYATGHLGQSWLHHELGSDYYLAVPTGDGLFLCSSRPPVCGLFFVSPAASYKRRGLDLPLLPTAHSVHPRLVSSGYACLHRSTRRTSRRTGWRWPQRSSSLRLGAEVERSTRFRQEAEPLPDPRGGRRSSLLNNGLADAAFT
jgi:hypothetical protein